MFGDSAQLNCNSQQFAAALELGLEGIGVRPGYPFFPTDQLPWYRTAVVLSNSGMPWSLGVRVKTTTFRTAERARG